MFNLKNKKHPDSRKCDLCSGQGREQLMETVFDWTQMLDLADKDFNDTLLSMFKELKQIVFKDFKENVMAIT